MFLDSAESGAYPGRGEDGTGGAELEECYRATLSMRTPPVLRPEGVNGHGDISVRCSDEVPMPAEPERILLLLCNTLRPGR